MNRSWWRRLRASVGLIVAAWLAWLRDDWQAVRPTVAPSVRWRARARVLLRRTAFAGLAAVLVASDMAWSFRDLRGAGFAALLARRRIIAAPPDEGGGGGGGDGDPLHYFRPLTINAELPRGVTTNHDILFDEATQTISTVGGSSYAPLWNWDQQRVGSARHAAVNTTRTVTGTGSTAYTSFQSHVSDFAAGSGDWEILVPASMTLSDTWTPPNVTGDRRLFITYVGSLPTADDMPTTTALGNCSVWTGPTVAPRGELIDLGSPTAPKITLTGVVLRPTNTLSFAVVRLNNPGTISTVDDLPNGFVGDRFWIDGSQADCRRGFSMNARKIALIESYITDIKISGSEAHAINGHSGSRYIYMRNFYAEAMDIGILWGGAQVHQQGSGIFDPQDILSVRTVCAKKSEWIDDEDGRIKNGFEAKNCRRWFILNCITARHYPGAQPNAMLFQNVQEGSEVNEAWNTCSDIVVHNHEFKDCQRSGIAIAARINFDGTALQEQPSNRLVFDNIRFINQGGTNTSFLFVASGDVQNVLCDRWTAAGSNMSGLARGNINNSGAAFPAANIRLTNWAGRWGSEPGNGLGGLTGSLDNSSVNTYGRAWLDAATDGDFVWDGHAFYGGDNTQVTNNQPGLTFYHSAGNDAAAAAAMGINTTTGIITGDAINKGVGGTMPGADHDQLDAALAGMASWAYSR